MELQGDCFNKCIEEKSFYCLAQRQLGVSKLMVENGCDFCLEKQLYGTYTGGRILLL